MENWSAKLHELGRILLTTLFLVKQPPAPTTRGRTPKAHFMDWFATTIPSNTYIFASASAGNTFNKSLPLAAQRLRASDITVLLTGLSSATGDANAILHGLKVQEVITLLNLLATQTAIGGDAFISLKVLINAILPQPVPEDDCDKSFKAKVKDFRKRVMSADVLMQIEKDWKYAFQKEKRDVFTQHLIDEGLIASRESHNKLAQSMYNLGQSMHNLDQRIYNLKQLMHNPSQACMTLLSTPIPLMNKLKIAQPSSHAGNR